MVMWMKFEEVVYLWFRMMKPLNKGHLSIMDETLCPNMSFIWTLTV